MNLYTFNINDFTPDEYSRWYSLMSEKKKQKVDNLKFDYDKKCSVAGEMLARKGIKEALGVSVEEIKFTTVANGKPAAENLDIHFNISHSDNMVVCAVSENEIGIDIERIRPINLKIAKRISTKSELEYILGCSIDRIDYSTEDPDTLRRFFEVWTGKEAYFKLTGTGLTNFQTINTLDNQYLHTPIYMDDYIIRIAQK